MRTDYCFKSEGAPNSKELFNRIYEGLAVPCVSLIESGKEYEAYIKYTNYTNYLREIYSA